MLGIPSRIGDYDITRQLGQGGMGAVFEGVHTQTQAHVAIKMLMPHLASQPDVVGRFFNEARAVRAVRHPSVVEIFDVGQLPGGSAYMVMEFLAGETLSAHLKRSGRLGAAALPILREVAAAVAQAHERGIIHRDLKPDNIMLVTTESGVRVKVLDFGIAKIAQDGELAAGMGVRTRTGQVFGTPTYMSPEQCRGSGGVGAPTDVYAMGAMLHELVAGKPPFVATGIGEVLAKQIYEAPPPLSTLVPDVDASLEQLTLSMLDKDPERRPTMRRALAAFDRLIGGAPGARAAAKTVILSSGPMPIPRTGRAARWAAIGAGLALVAGGAALALHVRQRAIAAPAAATAPSESAPAVEAAPSTPPKSPGSIIWLVKSEPEHADVIRTSDGTLLGRTPWYVEQPVGSGRVDVVVRKSGYVEQHATLDLGANSSLHVRLERAHHTRTQAHKEEDLDVRPLQ